MKEYLSFFGTFVFLAGFMWNIHRVLNNKINKSSGRIDGRIDKLEGKVVYNDVFKSFKETAEAKHKSLEGMQAVFKESLKEASHANIKDHEQLMRGISRQSEQIGKLPLLIQTTIRNTLNAD